MDKQTAFKIDQRTVPRSAQNWKLEIFNVVTGEKLFTRNVSGNSVSLNTSGWKRGLYAVRAIVDKEVLAEKVQIK